MCKSLLRSTGSVYSVLSRVLWIIYFYLDIQWAVLPPGLHSTDMRRPPCDSNWGRWCYCWRTPWGRRCRRYAHTCTGSDRTTIDSPRRWSYSFPGCSSRWADRLRGEKKLWEKGKCRYFSLIRSFWNVCDVIKLNGLLVWNNSRPMGKHNKTGQQGWIFLASPFLINNIKWALKCADVSSIDNSILKPFYLSFNLRSLGVANYTFTIFEGDINTGFWKY